MFGNTSQICPLYQMSAPLRETPVIRQCLPVAQNGKGKHTSKSSSLNVDEERTSGVCAHTVSLVIAMPWEAFASCCIKSFPLLVKLTKSSHLRKGGEISI